MKWIRSFIIILLTLIVFLGLNRLVSPKYGDSLVEGSMTAAFYEEEKNHEIIFLGDCEVYANISPMVLYEEEGITAYVRGNSQQLIHQSYYLLKETLRYEIPKIVVFNVNSLRYGEEEKSEGYNRLMIDQMKWSQEKVDLIRASMTKEENFWSYVFPILRYHSRFSELSGEDFKYFFMDKRNTFNGFLINKEVRPAGALPTKKILPTYEFSKENMEYLEKIYELCKEHGIKLVLMKAPSLYPYWYDEYESQVVEYAKSHDLDYYNFTKVKEEIGLDFNTDTYDGGLHLNLSGATKLSKYFAKILKENYTLTDYRLDKNVNEVYNKKVLEYKKKVEE